MTVLPLFEKLVIRIGVGYGGGGDFWGRRDSSFLIYF